MQHDLFGNGTPPPASNGDAQDKQHPQHTPSSPNPYPPAHHNAPKCTSEMAAAMIAPYTPSQRERIYQEILAKGEHGLTDDEGMKLLGILQQSYPARRGELVKLGMIRDSGKRRKTRNGRPAAAWVAVDQQTKQQPK